jgi:hypothetical protein
MNQNKLMNIRIREKMLLNLKGKISNIAKFEI